MSGCVAMGPNALLCPAAYNAVKMALTYPYSTSDNCKKIYICIYSWYTRLI